MAIATVAAGLLMRKSATAIGRTSLPIGEGGPTCSVATSISGKDATEDWVERAKAPTGRRAFKRALGRPPPASAVRNPQRAPNRQLNETTARYCPSRPTTPAPTFAPTDTERQNTPKGARYRTALTMES